MSTFSLPLSSVHVRSPNETLFLESTTKIIKDDVSNSSFVQFQIWDFPGQIDFFDPAFDSDVIFGGCGALVFVIDAQDDYMESLTKLHVTVTKAYKVSRCVHRSLKPCVSIGSARVSSARGHAVVDGATCIFGGNGRHRRRVVNLDVATPLRSTRKSSI